MAAALDDAGASFVLHALLTGASDWSTAEGVWVYKLVFVFLIYNYTGRIGRIDRDRGPHIQKIGSSINVESSH